jgi:general nucleoside transport system permease protein
VSALRLSRRLGESSGRTAIIRFAGGALALVFAAVILQLTGRDAPTLAGDAWEASFGSRADITQMGALATPILMAAVAVAFSFRARMWNLGVNGQLLMGAWAAAGVGLNVDGPDWLLLVLMAAAAAAAGAVWVLAPALMRIKLGISEVITTLLLNSVAYYWVVYFATDRWRDPGSGVLNSTARIETDLPLVFDSTTLHAGFFVPVVLIVVFAAVFRFTRWGFEVDMTGGNPEAARVAGIPVERRLIGAMLASGALAGVAGMMQLTGSAHRLSPTLASDAGFTGFIVAALAAGSGVALLLVGGFIAFLTRAGITLQTEGLSTDVVTAINGVILVAVGLADVASRYRLVLGVPRAQRSASRTMLPAAGSTGELDASRPPDAVAVEAAAAHRTEVEAT